VFTAASEAFNRKNINASIDESIERFMPVMERARADGVSVRGYVSTVLGCPYQGDVPVADVVRVARRLHDLGCYEVSLGRIHGDDLTGAAVSRRDGRATLLIPPTESGELLRVVWNAISANPG